MYEDSNEMFATKYRFVVQIHGKTQNQNLSLFKNLFSCLFYYTDIGIVLMSL